jgi:hypothetical protein
MTDNQGKWRNSGLAPPDRAISPGHTPIRTDDPIVREEANLREGGEARWPARRLRAGRLWKGMDQKIERRRR